ncbi:MAG: agmatine deiminase family protein, partial [Chitinophagales bacterium]|nr:agmatine deiminase family protein [Chitinophagales bacterium]
MFQKISADISTPKKDGFFFPAEFSPQEAMWLSWIHKEASWPGKLNTVYKPYCEFIIAVARNQRVCINVADEQMKQFATEKIKEVVTQKESEILQNISFYFHPTNDAWCRDHGPAFVINPEEKKKAI